MRSQIFLSCVILLGLLSVPAYAQQIIHTESFNHPGIKWDWKIHAENYTFHVTTVSNYDMQNVTFNKAYRELVFTGNSTHDGNIAEIEIPTNLIGGNLTVSENGKPVSAIVIPGTNSSTIMLKFNQTGTVSTSVFGTTYLPEFSTIASLVMILSITMVLLVPKIRKF